MSEETEEGTILTLPSPCGHVLVADDERQNRNLLKKLIQSEGHRVSEASDGRAAMALIDRDPPDVILLDIMMPHADGYEVCRYVKQNPKTASIYVVMVTSLTDRKARIQGIDAGANDFLTKPPDSEEVLLRVRNAVWTKSLFDRVNAEGPELVALRRRSEVLSEMTKDLLLHRREVYGASSFLQMKPCDLSELAGAALNDIGLGTVPGSAAVYPESPGMSAWCDAPLLRRVVSVLALNTLKFSVDSSLRVILKESAHGVRVTVANELSSWIGPKMPYKRDEQGKTGRAADSGLDFCRFVIEAHGGRLGISASGRNPEAFWFELPARSKRNSNGSD